MTWPLINNVSLFPIGLLPCQPIDYDPIHKLKSFWKRMQINQSNKFASEWTAYWHQWFTSRLKSVDFLWKYCRLTIAWATPCAASLLDAIEFAFAMLNIDLWTDCDFYTGCPLNAMNHLFSYKKPFSPIFVSSLLLSWPEQWTRALNPNEMCFVIIIMRYRITKRIERTFNNRDNCALFSDLIALPGICNFDAFLLCLYRYSRAETAEKHSTEWFQRWVETAVWTTISRI